jgi:aryl-alcohol dehydrogenase-like predicted oxidoreductase
VRIDETLSAIDGLIKQGRIRYFCGSNLTGWQIQRYVEVAKRMGLTSKMVTLQVGQCNILIPHTDSVAFAFSNSTIW